MVQRCCDLVAGRARRVSRKQGGDELDNIFSSPVYVGHAVACTRTIPTLAILPHQNNTNAMEIVLYLGSTQDVDSLLLKALKTHLPRYTC
jgi:hypothetical protein